ncbi:hypothetical protein V1504DRAFT_436622 [Lipomyces starkeyi]
MVCRFFVGVGGAALLAVVGGALADMLNPLERGAAGAAVSLRRRLIWAQSLILLSAGCHNVIYRMAVDIRARRHSRHVLVSVHLKQIARTYLIRPLDPDPSHFYMLLIYGILYLFFKAYAAYPVSFNEERGWNLGVAALPFLGLALGIILGGVIILVHIQTRYTAIMLKEGQVNPEERPIPMMIGAVLLSAGLFWFAWTRIPIGIGLMTIFLQGLNHIIDVYTKNVNSAVAANVFLRSWFGAGFPMFAMNMYHNLGVPWATSLLAFLCVALAPVPILFFVYGKFYQKKEQICSFTELF